MRFNSKLVVSLLLTLPSAFAAVNGRCSSGNGVCISTNTCSNAGGSYISGLCPNDPNNVKCCNKACSYSGLSGQCKFTSDCNGIVVPGLCPGGSDFKCCIPRPTCKYNNKTWKCGDTSKEVCKNGKFVTGLCPGGSNIQCCVPK